MLDATINQGDTPLVAPTATVGRPRRTIIQSRAAKEISLDQAEQTVKKALEKAEQAAKKVAKAAQKAKAGPAQGAKKAAVVKKSAGSKAK